MTCKSLALMDFEKINYELIEHVLMFIVDGGGRDINLPKEGSILVFLPGKYLSYKSQGYKEIKKLH